MKNARQFWILIVVFIAIVTIGIATILVVRLVRDADAQPEGPILAYFHLHTDEQSQALMGAVREFESLFPEYEVTAVTMPYQDLLARLFSSSEGDTADHGSEPARSMTSVDVVTLIGADLTRPAGTIYSLSVPWTGSMWRLYFNVSVARDLGLDVEYLAAMDWNEFLETLERAHEAGIRPITVGARFYWPWLAWIQHISLALTGSDEPEHWPRALSVWESMERSGFIVDDYRNRNWAASVIDVATEQALFVLADDTLLRDLTPSQRELVRGVRFPGSGRDAAADDSSTAWLVGSVFYLAVPAGTDSPTGAADLVEYLRSEGVTQRLRRLAGIQFVELTHPGEPAARPEEADELPDLFPTLTHRVRDAELAPLLDWLGDR